MYCKTCGRLKVNNHENYLGHEMSRCFTVDLEDRVCDECEAKRRAQGCIGVINADIKMKRNKLEQVTTIDEDKFRVVKYKIIDYWKKHFTPDIELPKYKYWLDKFYKFIDDEFSYRPYQKNSLDINK